MEYTFENLSVELNSYFILFQAAVEQDWQLQCCLIGATILVLLLVLINIEWRRHGSNLMNLDLDRNRIRSDLSASKERVLQRQSFHESNENKLQTFPDEDPLTFVKKKN